MSLRPSHVPHITLADLKPGDVILSAGPRTDYLDRLILEIDEGDYTHASLWDGSMVYEATKEGVMHQPIDKDMEVQVLVDAYRYKLAGGDGWADPLFKVAETFVGAPYAYSELLLAGVTVLASEDPNSPVARQLIRIIFADVAESLEQWIESWMYDGKKPMVCSQIIALAYYQAATDPAHSYGLKVNVDGSRVWPGRPPSSGAPQIVTAGDQLPAGFVAPRDLERSPSLELIGCLKDTRG